MNPIDIINKKREENHSKKYKKFNLNSNPFPKSGTANIAESDQITQQLAPISDDVTKAIANYIGDSLYSDSSSDDFKLIGTITGDYGTGKTQLLLFAKYLIQIQPKKAYVIYINNPGTKLSQLIGSIIESIGKEQFKKYLWNEVIDTIKFEENDYKSRLYSASRIGKGNTLPFPEKDPFSKQYSSNHKLFLEAFIEQIPDRKRRKEFNEILKKVVIEIIANKNDGDAVIANYFYDLISEDFGINKTWETITSGSGTYLENKVVKLLNAIIDLVQKQGFERFYLLVDEFEDITSGRLTKKEIDNYSYNLRALIDKQRRWCLLIAMTSEALADLKKVSPPLVDRLTDRQINIERLSDEDAERLITSYLNIARNNTDEDSLYPFDLEAIHYINEFSEELPRLFLRNVNYILERAVTLLDEGAVIGKNFVSEHLEN